jgi:hypothetical protein
VCAGNCGQVNDTCHTQHCLLIAASCAQIAKGKVQAVQSMYDALLAELQEHRPEVANAYKWVLPA